MEKNLLSLLDAGDGDFVSGQTIADRLGVTRAAVCKGVAKLRREGYVVESSTNKGYRITSRPDKLDAGRIASMLTTDKSIIVLDSVTSTNTYAKALAENGAPHGTIVIADCQTGGRGRFARPFFSPPGTGVYATYILRPRVPVALAAMATVMAAVSVCDALEQVCGLRPAVKWVNDVYLGGKKLCGILTEMSASAEDGSVAYMVVGIGINVLHNRDDFPEQLRDTATSLYSHTGEKYGRNVIIAALTNAVDHNVRLLDDARDRESLIARYRADLFMLGRKMTLARGSEKTVITAVDVDKNGALIALDGSGREIIVNSGEITIIL